MLSPQPQSLSLVVDPQSERAFFDIFRKYYDFEAGPIRRPDTGHYSLDRMVPLADIADNPELELDIIHVAGTKGKGSTCAFLNSLLASAGCRCGLYASPHLYSVRERFQIDGIPLPYELLLSAARDFEERIGKAELTPTLFEIMTVFSLRLFVDQGCRWCVLETGIGGVLDATNYVPAPRCTVITPVSLDHRDLLGDTVEQVAFQKAGIIKPHIPLVCGKQPFPEAEAVILRRADEVRARFYSTDEETSAEEWGLVGAPPFARENFALALTACRVLNIQVSQEHFCPPTLWGRFQQLREEPPVIIDAAHNADSARRLAEALRMGYPGIHFTIVLGVTLGKDLSGILDCLAPLDADFILTDPRPPKTSALAPLRACAESIGLKPIIQRNIQAPEDLGEARNGPLLFTGSFFSALIGFELFGKSEESKENAPV